MNRFVSSFTVMATSAALAATVTTPAFAQVQSDVQQDCLNSLYESGAKVASTLAKDVAKCVGDYSKGSLGITAQDCLTADLKGKVGKARVKAAGAALKDCSAPPTIGASSVVSINAAFGGNILRMGDVFGNPLDTALDASTGKSDASCQAGVTKSLGKVLKGALKDFLRCVNGGLRDESINSQATIGACASPVEPEKLQRLIDKGDADVEKRCASANIASLFPGDCGGEAVGDFFPCVANRLSCGLCVAVVTAGGATVDCDQVDDGVDNDSCTAGPDFPDLAADYTPGLVSYVDTVSLPPAPGGVPSCCRDFGTSSKDFIEGGTNNPDNALALLIGTIAGFGFDVQVFLDDAVQSGSLTLLLDHQDIVTDVLPDEFALVALFGSFDAGTSYVEAAGGTGEFIASLASFLGGTGTPATVFFPGSFDLAPDGMTAGPAGFSFPLPFGGINLELPISDVLVEGIPTVGSGISYADGQLSGFMQVDSFFAGLNAILDSSTCDCLGHASSIYTQNPSGIWSGACSSTAASLCTDPSESICVTLGGNQVLADPPQVCAVLPTIIQDAADLDLNDDPSRYEGFTVGLQFTAVPGTLTGVETP